MDDKKVLKLAAIFLKELSDHYGNQSCNDFFPPKNFSNEEIDSLFEGEKECLSSYDWAVVNQVAKRLNEISDK